MPTRHPAYRRALRTCTALLVAAVVTGCSNIPWLGGEKDPTPATKLTTIAPEVTATTLWSARLTKGSEGRRLYLVPAVGGGRVYVADARGRVVAADAGSGRVLWQKDTKLPLSAGPELAGERLILGTSDGQVIALSGTDGKQLWRAQLSGEVLSVPRRTDDGKVIIHTLDDSVFALDEAKGTELWRVPYPAPVLTLRGSGTPVIAPTGVIVGLAGGKLVKLDPADGTPLWEVIVTAPGGRSELARVTDIDADPVVIGKVIFVGTYNGDLAAVDLDGGGVLWRRELSSHAGLAATQSNLFITDSADLVWGADPVGGAGRWKQERLRNRQLTAPALLGNLIAVGDLDGWLHLLAQADGRLVGRTRVSKKAITARPLAVGNRLYVYATDGTLAVLSTGTAPGGSRGGAQSAAAVDEAALPTQVTRAAKPATAAPPAAPAAPPPAPAKPSAKPAATPQNPARNTP